jgi:uncharacterized protein with GYD domain
MAQYVLLSKLTDDGRETVMKKPERVQEVNAEVGTYGVTVLAQYAVLGPYDFVTIVEAPDNHAITKLSVALGARGSVDITTMPAMTVDEFVGMFKAA